jgi:arylsulfatase A-like enzyme
LLDYLHLAVPESPARPGRSFIKLLLGQSDVGRDSVVIYDEYGPTRMVRTNDWKYIHRYPDGPNELYDLQNDPDERVNCIDDAAQKNRMADMRNVLENWFAHYIRQEKDGRNLPVRGGGQLRPVGGKWEDGTDAFTGH